MENERPQTPRPAGGRRRFRGMLTTALILAVIIATGAAVARTPSSVGHWIDATGQDAYDDAYAAAFADLPKPSETRDIRTSYGFVRAYRFHGTGANPGNTPILLLPGTASGSPVWAANLPSLRQLGDVITIDLLGEPGKSVQSRPISNDSDKAAWLNEVITALPEAKVHVLGLSIGGWTAANLALRFPKHLASVTLLDPVMVLDDMPLVTVMRSIPASVPWLPRSMRDDFNSWVAGGAPVEHVAVANMIEAGMAHYSMAQPGPTRITPEELVRIKVPILAIIAGKSVMHNADTAIATAKAAFGEKRTIVYPDASHAINGEHANEIAVDLEKFLRTLP